jgi:glycosyltransferase involved in cell wall biosynthesis
MQIVHVVLALDVGGLERFVLQLMQEQRQLGHKVSLLCVDQPGSLASQVQACGIPVEALNAKPENRLAISDKAASLLASWKPEVIQSHQVAATRVMASVARSLNIPLVHTEHGNAFARSTGWIAWLKLWWVYRQTFRQVKMLFCVSDEIRGTLLRLRLTTTAVSEVIANGIPDCFQQVAQRDVRQELGCTASTRVVGSVGRLNEVKRFDLLLRAMAKLKSKHPDLRLLLVGHGPERIALEALAAELEIASITHFAGYQPEPLDYVRAMNVFAITSRSEGFPLSLLEAWSLAKPVVATAVGGLPQIIRDNVDGVLVPSGDVDAIAVAVDNLLLDQKAAEEMGLTGRRTFVEHYRLSTIAASYLEHYQRILITREQLR